MKNHKINNRFVIVFALLVVFALPCVSLATSFSDTQPGNVDNSLKMNLDSQSGRYLDAEQHTGHRGPGGPQPAATPIPSAVWLLGTGLVGLFGVRRRLKK